ncbi:HlyD family efflux transporter periplasmic adaptor subunit [Ahrensia sp. R2A130]|uniref:HlyD family efflux transporter periplasmic adaptor subunit n=1 Tax=Ahrensia sp. R2A130 TaxID=744979 RepID=UPI0001E0F80B|nr:HlyD family efflux transporter periplasmic adaptor subunit [Ahrensia sp. R2A130]EFL90993.1 peptidase M50 [Ahrensia sp. R2A130]
MDGVLNEEEREDVPLPVLRDDLEIVPTAPQPNGAPAWVIFDPAANRYFEIGRETLDLLRLWRVGTVETLVRRVNTEFGRTIDKDDVAEVIHFLISNALVRDIAGNDFRGMAAKAAAEKKSWFSTAMHSYLFFRIPLFRPDRFLRATWPVVQILFTRIAVWLFVVMAVAGLYLVSRQWEQFTGTFQYMLSWKGAAFYGLSLVIVKSLHELGHAYMAVRYGLRVPTIGIAFMVLMPVLYTDTSGAWRLRSRKPRLMIDGAGIFTELAIAAVATLTWAFLPDGPLRLVFFAMATTSWITSLAVNLNPLMRFDGYYILSDGLGFQNLQNRGFEMARWRMREMLFGLGDDAPEPLTPKLRRLIIVHAWATWIYRFFLFLGIAILVYAFFIKIVGILLFIVEIVWFIAKPVAKEMAHWWSIRSKIMAAKRILITGSVLAGLTIAAIIPWSTQIRVPSLMTAGHEQALYAPFPAVVQRVTAREGDVVAQGDVVFVLDAPQLRLDLKLAQEQATLIESRIDRTGSDETDRASLIVLQNELEEVREKLLGLRRVEERLTVRAPFSGRVTDMDPELHEGMWINPKTSLALLQEEGGSRIKGYVSERNIFRVGVQATATFVPDNPELPKIDATVSEIATAASEELDEPYLALPFGGPIAVEEASTETLRPTEARYALALVPLSTSSVAPQMAVRGVAIIKGEPQSFYARAKRQVLKVLVREMGV